MRWLVTEVVVAAAATVGEVAEAVVEAAEEDSPAQMQRPWVATAAGRMNDTQTKRDTDVRTLTLAILRFTKGFYHWHSLLYPFRFHLFRPFGIFG